MVLDDCTGTVDEAILTPLAQHQATAIMSSVLLPNLLNRVSVRRCWMVTATVRRRSLRDQLVLWIIV